MPLRLFHNQFSVLIYKHTHNILASHYVRIEITIKSGELSMLTKQSPLEFKQQNEKENKVIMLNKNYNNA